MSNLPNAPLIEVVLELRWQITNKNDLTKIQYLYGDIYNELKHKYPYREVVQPMEVPVEILINHPVHRYRSEESGYPLIQIGPGLITQNMDRYTYGWEFFLESSIELISSFIKIFPLQKHEYLIPSLLFIDFFPFNFENSDVYEYINEKFNLSYSQSFIDNHSNPKNLNLGFYYDIPLGELSVNFLRGKNLSHDDGIILQSRIGGSSSFSEKEELTTWIKDAHEVCSDLFKRLTEGELYKSFSN